MQTLHIPPYKRFVPVHLAHASKGGNVTNSIQDTVCLELGMYSRTASSYEDLICQNLFQTHQLISLKDSPTNKSAVRLKNYQDIQKYINLNFSRQQQISGAS